MEAAYLEPDGHVSVVAATGVTRGTKGRGPFELGPHVSSTGAASARLVPGVRRIAVLRANGIGDLMFVLPALGALEAAYPEAEITLLGAPWHADFLERRPGPVRRVVPVPPSQGVWLPPGSHESGDELERFFAHMTQERFDLALQLHGGGRHSNPFTLRLGARVTAGLCTPDAERLDRWVSYVYYHPEILRYLEVVALVGAGPVSLEPRLAVTDDDLAEAEEAFIASTVREVLPIAAIDDRALPARPGPVTEAAAAALREDVERAVAGP